MKFKFTLDPTPKKFTCPSCEKKRFVRYIDTETGEYLPIEFGRCDRESSCTYHNKPQVTLSRTEGNAASPRRCKNKTVSKNPASRIPHVIFRQTMSHYHQNNFVTILLDLFSKTTVKKLILDFLFGTSSHWPSATIFWQIDKDHKVRSGQVMLFDVKTRSRVKMPFPHITWAHTLLMKQKKLPNDFTLSQCLYGEHQLIELPKDKQVAIVESAKTAIIMTGIFSHYTWMATGGSHNIKPGIFQPIKERNIILYPDLGQFKKWNEKAAELRKQGFRITVSTLLETCATKSDHQSGLDIADYFINNTSVTLSEAKASISSENSVNYPRLQPEDNQESTETNRRALSKDDLIYNKLITENPAILQLVEEFQLVNSKTNKPFIT